VPGDISNGEMTLPSFITVAPPGTEKVSISILGYSVVGTGFIL